MCLCHSHLQLPRRLWPWGKSSSSLLARVNLSLTLPATRQSRLRLSPLFTWTRWDANLHRHSVRWRCFSDADQIKSDLNWPACLLFLLPLPSRPSSPFSHSSSLLSTDSCRFLLISLSPQAANGGGAFSDYSSSVPSTPSISQREMRIETIAASNTPTPIRKQSKRRSNIFTVSMRQLMQSNTHSHY